MRTAAALAFASAKVPTKSVRNGRVEMAEIGTSLTAANALAIRRALEAAGIEFIGSPTTGRASALLLRDLALELNCVIRTKHELTLFIARKRRFS
jgi:hypothetical protein